MSRETRATAVIDFLKSEEFVDIIKATVKNETDLLQKQIEKLNQEVIILRESNIELVNLLTNIRQGNIPSETGIFKNKNNNNSILNVKQGEANIYKNSTQKTDNKKGDKKFDKNIETAKNETFLQKEDEPSTKESHTLENNKWEFPKRRQRRNRNTTIYGRAAEDTTFKGVMKYIDYHVYRLPPNCNINEVVSHLASKNITDIKCEKMISKYPDEYSSFKISVAIKHDREFRNPNIWPEYVVINRFLARLGEIKKTS